MSVHARFHLLSSSSAAAASLRTLFSSAFLALQLLRCWLLDETTRRDSQGKPIARTRTRGPAIPDVLTPNSSALSPVAGALNHPFLSLLSPFCRAMSAAPPLPSSSSSNDDDPHQLLPFAAASDAVLHRAASSVSFPLSAADRLLIARMCHGIQPASLAANKAAWPSAVGMAAPQWGAPKRIFLFCPNRAVHDPDQLHVILNARYWPLEQQQHAAATDAAVDAAAEKAPSSASSDRPDSESDSESESGWEGCFSLPSQRGLVRRHRRIRVEYDTPEGVHVRRDLTDPWEARVFQHECDHTDGKLHSTATLPDGTTLRCSELRACTKEQVIQERATAAAVAAARAKAAPPTAAKATCVVF